MDWNPALHDLKAYAVPDTRGLIKLDAMENPYPLPDEVAAAFAEALPRLATNRYPDAGAAELKHAIQQNFPVADEFGLVLGNGSDELITMLLQTILRPGARVLAVEPSFVMYRHLAHLHGIDYVGVPLRADFSLDLVAMLDAIAENAPDLVFIASPNNPTGNVFADSDLRALAQACPGLLVLDEAYIPYAGGDGAGLAASLPNVVLMRTLSKWGLAGLRLGFVQARAAVCEQLEKVRLPYNINVLSQTLGCLCLQYADAFEAQIQALLSARESLAEALQAPGVEVYPSRANFLLLRVPDALGCQQKLRAAGLQIKCLHGAHPLLDQCLRISIGSPAENQQLLSHWRAAL